MKCKNWGIVIIVLFIMLNFPFNGIAQNESASSQMDFRVDVIFPTYSIDKKSILEAQEIADLNRFFKSEWVREYLNVEISSLHNGKWRKAYSKSGKLTNEQKKNLTSLDSDSEFTIHIDYMPENNLKDNDAKDINFKVYVNPDKDASFVGGEEALRNYLRNSVMDKIPDSVIKEYNVAAINFTIDQDGKVINPELVHPTNSVKWDEVIFQTICNMDDWIPARFDDGKVVSQTFMFTLGDMKSCTINTLGIRNHIPEEF